jgi:hypothetical protein
MRRWAEGIVYPDRHSLITAPGTEPGTYFLLAGMYSWPSVERLPAYDTEGRRWQGDLVTLGTVRLTSP